MHSVLAGVGSGVLWRRWCEWKCDTKEMSDDGAMVRVVVEGEFEGMEGERTQKKEIRNIVPHVKF